MRIDAPSFLLGTSWVHIVVMHASISLFSRGSMISLSRSLDALSIARGRFPNVKHYEHNAADSDTESEDENLWYSSANASSKKDFYCASGRGSQWPDFSDVKRHAIDPESDSDGGELSDSEDAGLPHSRGDAMANYLAAKKSFSATMRELCETLSEIKPRADVYTATDALPASPLRRRLWMTQATIAPWSYRHRSAIGGSRSLSSSAAAPWSYRQRSAIGGSRSPSSSGAGRRSYARLRVVSLVVAHLANLLARSATAFFATPRKWLLLWRANLGG